MVANLLGKTPTTSDFGARSKTSTTSSAQRTPVKEKLKSPGSMEFHGSQSL